jgi:hypothetical protein
LDETKICLLLLQLLIQEGSFYCALLGRRNEAL